MSGEPEVLAVDAAGLTMKGWRKRLIHHRFLLEYQFVTTKNPDGL